jgi:hypothetical protein
MVTVAGWSFVVMDSLKLARDDAGGTSRSLARR